MFFDEEKKKKKDEEEEKEKRLIFILVKRNMEETRCLGNCMCLETHAHIQAFLIYLQKKSCFLI